MVVIVYVEISSGEVKERRFSSPYLAQQFLRKIEHSDKLRLVSVGKQY